MQSEDAGDVRNSWELQLHHSAECDALEMHRFNLIFHFFMCRWKLDGRGKTVSCSLNYLNGSLFGFAALAPLKADCLASLLVFPKQKEERRLKLQL